MNDERADQGVTTAATVDGTEKARREPLTRQRIVRAALDVMDLEGLEAVTMRRIGRELGVEAMSLYNHVKDKEDILDSICEEVLAEFRVPEAEDWGRAARLGAREYRRLLLAHPNVITLMSERRKPFTDPDSLRAWEFALDVFRTAGLSEEDAVKAFHAFGGYIIGFVTLELGPMLKREDDEARRREHEEMARLLATANLPRLREALPHFMDCDIEEQFEFGLDLLIQGLRAKISARS